MLSTQENIKEICGKTIKKKKTICGEKEIFSASHYLGIYFILNLVWRTSHI